MKILALDYGTKRIGVAISDFSQKIAFPREYIANTPDALTKIAAIVQQEDVELIILGNPKSLKNTETAMTKEVHNFLESLQNKVTIKLQLLDERLSSKHMEKELIKADFSRQKRKETIDSSAACFLLQGYLDRTKEN
jgi:putative holliday junction resolvase